MFQSKIKALKYPSFLISQFTVQNLSDFKKAIWKKNMEGGQKSAEKVSCIVWMAPKNFIRYSLNPILHLIWKYPANMVVSPSDFEESK